MTLKLRDLKQHFIMCSNCRSGTLEHLVRGWSATWTGLLGGIQLTPGPVLKMHGHFTHVYATLVVSWKAELRWVSLHMISGPLHLVFPSALLYFLVVAQGSRTSFTKPRVDAVSLFKPGPINWQYHFCHIVLFKVVTEHICIQREGTSTPSSLQRRVKHL